MSLLINLMKDVPQLGFSNLATDLSHYIKGILDVPLRSCRRIQNREKPDIVHFMMI